eukprot:scaffold129879_cov63-Phaeocystis_antarctica.AAC.3
MDDTLALGVPPQLDEGTRKDASKASAAPRATTRMGPTRQEGQRSSCSVHASQQTQWPHW